MIGYLAGPIARCDDNEAHGWRNQVVEATPQIHWNNPMDRDFRYFKGHENPNNHYDEAKMNLEIVELIVDGDKQAIRDSDLCLFNVWQYSAGTMMELIYAWDRGCFNITVLSEKLSRSPWVVYHSHVIVPRLEDAVDYINNM